MTNEIDEKPGSKTLLVFLFLIIVVIWWFSPKLATYLVESSSNWDDKAEVGDSFGLINSLFSGLALAGVVVAIYLQKQELRLQRKELEYTRDELKRSAAAHEQISEINRNEGFLRLAEAYSHLLRKSAEDFRSRTGTLPPNFGEWRSEGRFTNKESPKMFYIVLRGMDYCDLAVECVQYFKKNVKDPEIKVACFRMIQANLDEWIINRIVRCIEPLDKWSGWLSHHYEYFDSEYKKIDQAQYVKRVQSTLSLCDDTLFRINDLILHEKE